MCFKYIAFAFTYCVIFQCSVIGTDDGKSKEENEEEDYQSEYDSHTFVALLDIVFSDGSKRSCTGTIIHDNVVITAAHCFAHEFEDNIKPELTASFVVIGTKKMFDTGYEQYLPIERILTHPNYRGWTADLSLVYTFAGMTSDKPGKAIPLAGEKMSNPVDSNVTVLSWGHYKDEEVANNWHISMTPKTPCPESSSSEDMGQPQIHRFTVGIPKRAARRERQKQVAPLRTLNSRPLIHLQHRFQTEYRNKKGEDLLYQYPLLQHKVRDKQMIDMTVKKVIPTTTTKRLSRYLTSNEDEEGIIHQHRYRPSNRSTFRPYYTALGIDARLRGRFATEPSVEPLNGFKTFYKNWRRRMGSQQNKLTVEVFGFVNLATCKKIVEGAMPPRYEIKNGEVACYSSEEHYLTDEDSGAPAIRHGQLVAVTVGGAQCDGDQVGVGMKMSCYCSWIADNLPAGAPEMNCCKNCCDVNRHTEESSNRHALKHKNKYLYK